MPGNGQHWDHYYQQTHPDHIPWEHFPYSFLKDLVESGRLTKGNILDVGCGTGNQSIFLAKHGFTVTGVDLSAAAITRAQQKAARQDVQVRFVAADATQLSTAGLPTDFDCLVDWGTMHGIAEEERAAYIQELTSHLKPGGYLVLRVFSHRDPDNKHGRNASPVSGHRYFFTRAEIEKLYTSYTVLDMHGRMLDDHGKMRFFDEYLLQRKA